MLFLLQDGECAICREPLPFRFHVDHIVPVARGGSSLITNLQGICETCHRSKTSYDGSRPQTTNRAADKSDSGYGKTETGLGAHVIARDDDRIDRTLIIVVSDIQRNQYVDEVLDIITNRFQSECKIYRDPTTGRDSSARLIDGTHVDLRLSWENQCEIFVTTIHHVVSSPEHFRTLLSKLRWNVIVDEVHKYSLSENKRWGKAANELLQLADMTLALTATPIRTDGAATPLDGLEIDSIVSIKEAYEERAIRGVVAHWEFYDVHIIVDDIEEVVSTADLLGQGSMDNYEKKRCLRYNAQYLGGILSSAVECLDAKNLRHPDQHQMLVFAMTQQHAKHVSDVLRDAYGAGFSDWIGERRSYLENAEVLKRYLANTLKCLVQVDKASEGFNNPRSSVGVFLNILRKNTIKQQQQGGRCLRRNHRIELFDEDYADLFASPDTEAAEYIKELAMLTIGDIEPGDERKPAEPGEPTLYPIPPLKPIVASASYDRSEIYRRVEENVPIVRERLAEDGKVASDDDIRRVLTAHFVDQREKVVAAAKEHEESLTSGRVETAVRQYAFGAAALRIGRGSPQYKRLGGYYCGLINTQWLTVGGRAANSSLYPDLVKKFEWVRNLNERLINTREVPLWLGMPSWL
jgi:hypothetical protein